MKLFQIVTVCALVALVGCSTATPASRATTANYEINVKVNVDESPDLAAKFGIMSIPALLLFKGGELAAQKIGYMGKDEVLAFVS